MAGYPTSVGFPNHSGSYIPTMFAMQLLIEFYKKTIFLEIATTEHEGDLSKGGDILKIRNLPEIDSKPWVKGQDLEYQTPEGGSVDLTIDKGQYWGISLDDLDGVQIDLPYAQKWAAHAATKQTIAIDKAVLAGTYSSAHADNQGATAGVESSFNLGTAGVPWASTKENLVDKIIECGVVLDEQDVPDENRWFAIPSWMCGQLKSSDLKDASLTGDDVSPLRNGRVGSIDRFSIYRTNNLATGTDTYPVTNCMFGHKSAIAFASQMMKTETLRNTKAFGDIMRSLQAFGYLVQKREGLGLLYARNGS